MAIKVLVVDDEPDVAVIFRQKFRRRIAAGELEFCFAENGRQALELLQQDPEISLVFTDIRMPSMDGLTFLRELNALGREALLPMVVSAYDDMPNIREAMRQGAWDFVTKPIDLEDLERVLNGAVAEIGLILEGIQAKARLSQVENARLLAIRSKEMQQEFFENITHELRTPLTLLLAPLETALGLTSEEEVVGYLRQAQKSGLILLDLVNQLLDFAKVDAKMLQPRPVNVDVSEWAMELAGIFRPLAQQRGIAFETAIAKGIVGRTDPRMLSRICLNLLSNAFKFTPSGGKVEWVVGADGGELEVAVINTGSGLSRVETENIFLRFRQASNALRGAGSGTGLGLTLCQSLTELLGGKLCLDAEIDGLTRFSFTIPLEAIDPDAPISVGTDFGNWVYWRELDPRDSVSTAWEDAENGRIPDGEQDADKPLILVAEDHPDMRRYISQLLKEEFSVITAENGQLAMEMAEEWMPDLIVTDWMMPVVDGLELLKRLRHDRGTQHIPVVMLTAKADLEHRVAGMETGAEAYLGKPFHPKELLAVIHSQFAHRDRLRERFKTELLRPDRHASASMEDQFLADLKVVMEKNMMNEQFGVETMADALAMSRRTLVRKLTAVSGQAPVKFIRNYRLERAMQMLKDNSAPIWEIAVKTGFGSASYFTKCFKDHYGISPREAIHQN